jgi:hypothetical protein
MAKVLKLTGLKTYTGKATGGSISMVKGQTARFSDVIANEVLKGGRLNSDKELVPYWEEVGETDPTYDFTVATVENNRAEEIEKASQVAAASAASQPIVRSQRATPQRRVSAAA